MGPTVSRNLRLYIVLIGAANRTGSFGAQLAFNTTKPLNPKEEFYGKPVLKMESAILNRTLPNDPYLYEIEGILEKYCVLVEGSIIVDIWNFRYFLRHNDRRSMCIKQRKDYFAAFYGRYTFHDQ